MRCERLETKHKHIKSYSTNKSKALGMILFFTNGYKRSSTTTVTINNGNYEKLNNNNNSNNNKNIVYIAKCVPFAAAFFCVYILSFHLTFFFLSSWLCFVPLWVRGMRTNKEIKRERGTERRKKKGRSVLMMALSCCTWTRNNKIGCSFIKRMSKAIPYCDGSNDNGWTTFDFSPKPWQLAQPKYGNSNDKQ